MYSHCVLYITTVLAHNMPLQLLKAYSERIMWACAFMYLLVSLPGLESATVGTIAVTKVRAFLLLPTYVSIGLTLILLFSSDKQAFSFPKSVIGAIFMIAILLSAMLL